jgi:L-lactate dehydrogenase complex protein LldE
MLQNGGARYAAGDSVALFIPCYVDMFSPHVGRACVALFERLNIGFDYPRDQTCCGQPAYNAGRAAEASGAAEHFAAVFEPYRWIVAPSGSCAAMAKRGYAHLDPGSRAAVAGERVFDLASFLVDVVGVVDVGARFPHSVTYHDGCHGRRELRCTSAALALLRAVRDMDYREIAGMDECCGFGGLFSVKYDQLSSSMGQAKCMRSLETGAEYLVSGDSSCLLHVGGMLRSQQAAQKTLHIAEVLAQT